MIIDSTNISNKIQKKLFPTRLKINVSFLSFVLTDDEMGIVLYKNGDLFLPYEKDFLVEENKKFKKLKTFEDLIGKSYMTFPQSNDVINKASEEFFLEFETELKVDILKEFFELSLSENVVTLTKHIVCVIKEINSLENTFNNDSKIISFSKINEFLKENNIPNYLKYYLNNLKF